MHWQEEQEKNWLHASFKLCFHNLTEKSFERPTFSIWKSSKGRETLTFFFHLEVIKTGNFWTKGEKSIKNGTFWGFWKVAQECQCCTFVASVAWQGKLFASFVFNWPGTPFPSSFRNLGCWPVKAGRSKISKSVDPARPKRARVPVNELQQCLAAKSFGAQISAVASLDCKTT